MRLGTVAIMCLAVGLTMTPILSTQAGSSEFQIVWTLEIPRHVYFIGEEINFTATATSATDPSLHVPNEFANVQIRNDTGVDIWDWQAMTDANGTASLWWNTTLTQKTGNYTVVLTDGYNNTVSTNFTLLFNQDAYNQGRLDQLQREIDAQNQYLNILFERDFWLVSQVQAFQQESLVVFAVTLIGFLMMFSMFMADRMRRSTFPENRDKAWARGFRMLGMSSTPPSRLTDKQPEVAAYTPNPDKIVPRLNMTEFCDRCDPEHKVPMTLARLAEHKAMHEHLWLGIEGWRKKRAALAVMKATYPKAKNPREYEQDKPKNRAMDALLEKAALAVTNAKNGRSSENDFAEVRDKAKAYSEIRKNIEPVYKKPSAGKQKKKRKLRGGLMISTSSETRPAQSPQTRTKIDDLYDDLKEKWDQ